MLRNYLLVTAYRKVQPIWQTMVTARTQSLV